MNVKTSLVAHIYKQQSIHSFVAASSGGLLQLHVSSTAEVTAQGLTWVCRHTTNLTAELVELWVPEDFTSKHFKKPNCFGSNGTEVSPYMLGCCLLLTSTALLCAKSIQSIGTDVPGEPLPVNLKELITQVINKIIAHVYRVKQHLQLQGEKKKKKKEGGLIAGRRDGWNSRSRQPEGAGAGRPLPAAGEAEQPRPCVGPGAAQGALASAASFGTARSSFPWTRSRSRSSPGAARAVRTGSVPLQEEPFSRPWPVSVPEGLCGNRSGMDRYRYFIFNQRNMVVLGMLQIAFSAVCVTSGFIDGIFRTESQLGKTRTPIWAGMVMGVPGVLALFSSQRKNPVLVNVLIVASIISCVAILMVIVYSSFTLSYGEEEELSSAPVHVIHTRFILSKVVKGANIALLAASTCSAFLVLAMAYLGCRSLPRCSCYDSVTGMEWLQPSEDQNQAVEMVCAVQSSGGRIFTDHFPAQDVDAEEDTSKPPPYIRMT
ncbi:uncharacterized protein M8220_003899 [Acridotheres tristis]